MKEDKIYWVHQSLDGVLIALEYDKGKLTDVYTEDNKHCYQRSILNEISLFTNIPEYSSYNDPISIEGFAVLSWDNFKRINDTVKTTYYHPKFLVEAIIKQYEEKPLKESFLDFFAYNVSKSNLYSKTTPFETVAEKMKFLEDELGFQTVGSLFTTKEYLNRAEKDLSVGEISY